MGNLRLAWCLLLVACSSSSPGGSTGFINGLPPATIQTATDMKQWSGASAPGAYYSGLEPLLLAGLAGTGTGSGSGSGAPACPVKTMSGTTSSYEGGCTDSKGRTWFGSATSTGDQATGGTITYDGFGYDGTNTCMTMMVPVHLVFDGTLHQTIGTQNAFTVDVTTTSDGVDSTTCTTLSAKSAVSYSGSFTPTGADTNGDGTPRRQAVGGRRLVRQHAIRQGVGADGRRGRRQQRVLARSGLRHDDRQRERPRRRDHLRRRDRLQHDVDRDVDARRRRPGHDHGRVVQFWRCTRQLAARRRARAGATFAAMAISKSQAIYERAKQLIPGGVNSPVRACRSVGADPVFVAQGDGATITDVDGNRYIDMIGSWGPLILGHAYPEILDAIAEAMASGTTFGAPTEIEVQFAEVLTAAYPSMQMVRAVSSGTEATMSALRLARGFTGRSRIIKTDGGYHGHADMLLVAAGSGAATLGIPGSAGVPEGAAKDTLVVPYNDLAATEAALATGDVAAVIIEPVAGNMGLVPPAPGYLEGLRAATQKHGALLIFDEVISGFRVAYGGAQGKYGVTPDLTCLGKIVGGGLPAAAFGGRADIMHKLAPLGPVYQAGTLSGNPLAMAAGLKCMEILARPGTYERLEQLGARLGDGLAKAAAEAKVAVCINRIGSMVTMFFAKGPVTDYATAKTSDTARFGKFFRAMRERGVFLPPSQFEAMFVSLAHTDEDIDNVVKAARDSL